MRTSEMIAALEKNPKLKFTNRQKIGSMCEDGGVVVSNTIGFVYDKLCWTKPDGNVFGPFVINKESFATDWQIVPQPVPVWEAIKAWKEGKEVYAVIEDTIKDTFILPANYTGDGTIPVRYLSRGVWYIEEGNDEN